MDINELDMNELAARLKAAQQAVKIRADLEILRRDWLGKEGVLKTLFAQMRDLSPERKPQVASGLNEIKNTLEAFLREREAGFLADDQQASLQAEFFDLSLPGNFCGYGSVHPITLVERRISEILKPFGFQNVFGPEIETEYYCFDSLNIPKHHPARDLQDTFYTSTGHVLRTHTTSVQARELQKGKPPVKVASFGRAYRNETEDASHTSMLHQFELVWVEEGLRLSDLMGLISHILKGLYGKRRKVSFVPKYYPYTEPSLGARVDCAFCHGSGCPSCGRSGWATVGGSGMVHRNVLKEFGYDPEKVSGFAFGLGTSRLAAQIAGMPNLKMLYEGDVRVLKQIA